MRMKSPLAALIMAAALLVPPVARASDQPAWSVSLLGGYSQFSDKLFYPSDSLADAPVAGFRFGRAFGNWWTLEGTASYASTHGLKRNGVDGPDVVLLNGSGSLVAQITPPNQLRALYLSGGFGYNPYKSDKGKDDVHYGVLEGAGGWKKWFNSGVGPRLEACKIFNMPKKKFTNAHKCHH